MFLIYFLQHFTVPSTSDTSVIAAKLLTEVSVLLPFCSLISLSLSLSLSRTGTCMHTHTNKTSVEVVRFLNIHYHTQLQDPTLKGATNATSISWVRMSWDYVISNCRKWNCDFGIYLQWPYINMRFHINWFRSCKVKNTDSTVTSYASLYIQEYGPGIY